MPLIHIEKDKKKILRKKQLKNIILINILNWSDASGQLGKEEL